MSRKEAEEVVKTALALAMSRDGSSGGLARLVTLTESGYISSSHIRLIRCLAVIGQASFTREHLV